jgi:8-oxo-dGTP pyrophosphatase MutT (NUDIX family)
VFARLPHKAVRSVSQHDSTGCLIFQVFPQPRSLTYTHSFPYPDTDPEAHANFFSAAYTLLWDSTPIGYILEPIFNRLAKVPISIKGELEVSRKNRTVSVFQFPTEEERSKAAAGTAAYWRENKTFEVLDGWRDELYPVYGPGNELLYAVERSAASLFGIMCYGVHMTCYVSDPTASYGMKIWVPRRAATKSTYAGMLDNTVAGGIAAREDPFEGLVREAEEEASLPEELVRRATTAEGSITYMHVRDDKAGGEVGLVQPECQWVYDLELPVDVVPKPNDSEVQVCLYLRHMGIPDPYPQAFYLWTIEEVQEHMAKGEFKPNCALLILDFFIRHGILTPNNEKDFDEIKRRIHRDIELPGPHREQ